jgi:uncharacterized membrane protein YkoI
MNLFSKTITLLSLAAALSGSAFAKSAKFEGSIPLQGKSKSEYGGLAKVTLQEAIAIATKGNTGKILEAVLEKDSGFLVYEIEVQNPDRSKKEFLIDAGNGKILDVKEQAAKSSKEDDDEDSE